MQEDIRSSVRIPLSTYRLQFSRYFTFRDASDIVDYLNDLGISDMYSSPYFKAKKGSLHGYDIIDHATLNPELGTRRDYEYLIDELHKYGMGHVLDIVPNHMCIEDSGNKWWMDVLENGPSSQYACFFDIDTEPIKKELRQKVLLPILGDQYGEVLENQELKLCFEEGSFFLHYYQHKLPIVPKTYAIILRLRIEHMKKDPDLGDEDLRELLSIITALDHLPSYTAKETDEVRERRREKEVCKKRLRNLYRTSRKIREYIDENVEVFNGAKGDPRSFDLLDELLKRQAYRLSHWRVATEEINYRRFFDINNLAAIRMEEPEVFEETHRFLFRLIREGKVTGLRVDHPDGLYDPSHYFHLLQKRCSVETSKTFYIVGEKILMRGEVMPQEWPIHSTTGYVFLNSVNGIFVETKNARIFDAIYSKFVGRKLSFQDVVYEKKKLIMQVSMSSEINTLGHYLNEISEGNRHTRDFTLNSLIKAIIEVIVCFPVYRTYVNSLDGLKDRDARYIEIAVSRAKKRNPAINASIFDFLKDVLLLNFPHDYKGVQKQEWLDFAMKFQQITGPVMAKGLEDTAFYIYNRFVSLNEVGGAPDRFGTTLDTFHGQNIERAKSWPYAMITTSTHDTKRGEDTRARLNVLSEIPLMWGEALKKWKKLNAKKRMVVDGRPVPDRNEEILLYQTLIGTWPVGDMNETEYEAYRQRIKDYMLKASREAKENTSWINPDNLYEEALQVFIDTILTRDEQNVFLREFLLLERMVNLSGMYNSLSQTLLKITSPGVPDFYQGTELWDFSLVDPDNRRPVDFGKRKRLMEQIKERERKENRAAVANYCVGDMENGIVKMYLIYRALHFRRSERDLFERGEYIPLEIIGDRSYHACAFARRLRGGIAVTVVPRFLATLGLTIEKKDLWKDTYIAVPFESTKTQFRNIFTGATINIEKINDTKGLWVSDILSGFPVALLGKDMS